MIRVLLLALLLAAAQTALAQRVDQASPAEQASEAQKPSLREAIAASHDPGQLLQVASAAMQRGDRAIAIKALERLVAIRPYNQSFALQLAALYAENEELSKSFEQLVLLQEAGMAVDLDAIPGLDNLRQYPLYDYLLEKMNEANQPHGNMAVVTEMADQDFTITGLTFHDGAFVVASLRTGEIRRVTMDGESSVVVDAEKGAELGAISAIEVAADGESLWASVNDLVQHVGHEPESRRAPELVRLSWSGEVLERIAVPRAGDKAQLAGLAVAKDGTVFVGDQGRAVVYKASSGDEELTIIGAAPRLTSLRAITLVDHESKLLMADFSLGLFVLDVATGEPTVVRSSPKLNLGGIEYLSSQGQDIVAIQPGHAPARVLRLKMNEDFSIVETGLVQARALPNMLYPMRGTFTDNAFVLASNSNVPLLRAKGEFAEGERAAPALVALSKTVEYPDTPRPPQPGQSSEDAGEQP